MSISNKGRKLPHKGQKATRGKPLSYDQLKTTTNISITPDALKGLDELAARFHCPSRSELFERLGRGTLTISEGQQSVLTEEEREALKKFKLFLSELNN